MGSRTYQWPFLGRFRAFIVVPYHEKANAMPLIKRLTSTNWGQCTRPHAPFCIQPEEGCSKCHSIDTGAIETLTTRLK